MEKKINNLALEESERRGAENMLHWAFRFIVILWVLPAVYLSITLRVFSLFFYCLIHPIPFYMPFMWTNIIFPCIGLSLIVIIAFLTYKAWQRRELLANKKLLYALLFIEVLIIIFSLFVGFYEYQEYQEMQQRHLDYLNDQQQEIYDGNIIEEIKNGTHDIDNCMMIISEGNKQKCYRVVLETVAPDIGICDSKFVEEEIGKDICIYESVNYVSMYPGNKLEEGEEPIGYILENLKKCDLIQDTSIKESCVARFYKKPKQPDY